jgi:hypothetical protein
MRENRGGGWSSRYIGGGNAQEAAMIRIRSGRGAKRALVFLAIMTGGVLLAATCNVTIQFDAIDLLFGTGDSVVSP